MNNMFKYANYKCKYLTFKYKQIGGADYIWYINPDTKINKVTNLSDFVNVWKNIEIKNDEISEILGNIINKFKSNIIDKKEIITNPEDFKFNLYEIINIPYLSYINDENYHTLIDNVFIPCFNKTFLSKIKISSKASKTDHFIFLNFENKIGVPKFVFKYRNIDIEKKYKIHLQIKHEYIIYVILKLVNLYISDLDFFKNNNFIIKFSLNSKTSNPSKEDTILLSDELNGGALPSIIIYSNENKEDTKLLIKYILNLFGSEEIDKIGLMNKEDNIKIPPFNIRFNNILAYTMGERISKLDDRIKAKGGKPLSESKFKIPKWLENKIDELEEKELNEYTLNYLGYEYCKNLENTLPYYLSSDEDMLSPEEIIN
jgi:DNA-binding ferritin-like protein (Dps family)